MRATAPSPVSSCLLQSAFFSVLPRLPPARRGLSHRLFVQPTPGPVNLFQAFGGCSDSPHQPLVAGLHAVRPGNSAGLARYFRPRGASLRSRSPASLSQRLWHIPYAVKEFYGFFYKKWQKNISPAHAFYENQKKNQLFIMEEREWR